MKECPKCHTRYDDSQNFCTKDGEKLVVVEEKKTETAAKPVPIKRTKDPHEGGEETVVRSQIGSPKGGSNSKKGGAGGKILIALVLIAVAGFAVYNYLNNSATYLRVEPEQITVPKGGGHYDVGIDYDGHMWKVNYSPDWVSASKDGQSVYVLVSPNTTGETREGSVTVQSGKLHTSVEIKQNAYATVLRSSFTTLTFSKSGGIQGFEVETDGAGWEAYYPEWLTVTNSDYEILNVECPENEGEYRTGLITLKEDYLQFSISVTQGGVCDQCHGKGTVPCSVCMGAGGFGYGMYYTQCMSCGGTGSVQCGFCHGSGERE